MIPYHRAYRLGLFMSPGGYRKVNRCLMRFLWGLPQGETLAVELRSLPRGRSPQLRLGGNRPINFIKFIKLIKLYSLFTEIEIH